MSIVFLDTEFNAHGGDLISLALVSSGGDEFYEVVEKPKHPHLWVKEHVIPKLLKKPIGRDLVRKRAFKWLQGATLIVADWPADFVHLLELMYKEHDPSQAFSVELRMELINSGKLFPTLPHNALSDAWALRDWYMKAFDENMKTDRVMPRPLLDQVLRGNFL